MAEAIDRNNRIERVEQFKPMTEAERDMLCKIFKVNCPGLVSLSPDRPQSHTDAVNRLHEIFADKETATSTRSRLREEGFIIRQEEDTFYAIDFKRHILIDLSAEGFNVELLQRKPKPKKQIQPSKTIPKSKKLLRNAGLRDVGGGSQGEKREWEVGHNGNYDEIDDGRTLKR